MMGKNEAGTAWYRTDPLQWPIPEAVPKEVMSGDDLLYARPFLSVQSDLDFDFEGLEKPALITIILAQCLQNRSGDTFTREEIWHWSLKKRLQGLLAVTVATIGRQLQLNVDCSGTNCREILELELDLAVLGDNRQPERISICLAEGIDLQVRLPTGNDQLSWQQADNLEPGRLFAEMASCLVVKVNGQSPSADWIVPESWLEKIGADLEHHDNLMTMQLKTVCPFCGADFEVDLDLEDKLLSVLAAEQKRIFDEIHQLASVYHWSEKEIINLPQKRRAYYLAHIVDGLSA